MRQDFSPEQITAVMRETGLAPLSHERIYRGRVDIDQRPAEVEKRDQIGHYEADLFVDKHHKGFLVTLVERASRLTLIGHVEHKTSATMTAEIVRVLRPHAGAVRSITFDNGREFAGHLDVARALDCRTYFAKPYHSWERGSNENANGLLRQYFPKGMDLRRGSANRLNHRPRKVLGFKTPATVFSGGA